MGKLVFFRVLHLLWLEVAQTGPVVSPGYFRGAAYRYSLEALCLKIWPFTDIKVTTLIDPVDLNEMCRSLFCVYESS